MVRNILINGKIESYLVLEDEEMDGFVNPIFELLKDQAERIDNLEEQNRTLIKHEAVLLNLLELSAETGALMDKNLELLQDVKEALSPEDETSGDTV